MPPLSRLWQLLTIAYTATTTAVTIVTTTDVACHLFMRWSLIIPKIHSKTVFRRGLPWSTDKYYCFDAYTDNEQEEAGDTTTHTFIKTPWPFCETRYFYFFGTRSGQASPSESCVFTYHNASPAPPPPVETSDTCQTMSGTYHPCQWHSAPSQTFTPDHDYKVTRISLILSRYDLTHKGPFTIKLVIPGGNCWSETILWQYWGYSTDLSNPNTPTWEHFDVPNIQLTSGSPYRIVVHCYGDWLYWNGTKWVPTTSINIKWWRGIQYCYDTRGDVYRGCNFRDSSGTWTCTPTWDMTFIVWE